jgi:hypothetical protein
VEVKSAPVVIEETSNSNKDAWSMGKGLVNLGNLKESMALPESANTFSSKSQPVYIKPAPQSAPGQGKFVPGMFMPQ